MFIGLSLSDQDRHGQHIDAILRDGGHRGGADRRDTRHHSGAKHARALKRIEKTAAKSPREISANVCQTCRKARRSALCPCR